MASLRPTALRVVVGVCTAAVLTVSPGAGLVSAHTEFDFSVPAQDDVVTEPVSEIIVAFTLPVSLVGDGFEVLDPQENLLQPDVATTDDAIYTLLFDPPLAGGTVGVRYTVRAEDGHEQSGAFSFTVDAPVSTTPPATVTTATPETTPPSTAEPDVPTATSAPADTTTPATVASETPASPATDEPEPTIAAAEAVSTEAVVATLDNGDDGGSSTGLVIALGAVVLAGVGAMLAMRSRSAA